MQAAYWTRRRQVLVSLGGAEDACVVASDAELDAKLELFRSIADSCVQLQRQLDTYQERLCVLAQEESATGKFLKDAGKRADSAGKHMVSAGKAISYSGQQRLGLRGPLLRMYHEVETFRNRAVSDMRATVSAMEKSRGEYRAALCWMKAASAQLDPDTGRGLDKFRKAQRHVRESKRAFDKLTLDVLQKIDLLAAARCNMFSHVLAKYQTSFFNFSTKVAQTLIATSNTMHVAPKYDFCILKELSQSTVEGEGEDLEPQDKDQMLFFQDEYKDEATKDSKKAEDDNKTQKQPQLPSEASAVDLLASTSTDLIDTSCLELGPSCSANMDLNSDLAGLRMDCGDLLSNLGTFMPSQLLQDSSAPSLIQGAPMTQPHEPTNNIKGSSQNQATSRSPSEKPKKADMAAWFKIFAELDPLANPDALPGSNTNQSHAA